MAWFDRTPYPGLRPFTREESDLFFGRDGCVEKMLDRLTGTRFLAVLGSSGTGKSSLVETGLLSSLDMGLLPGAGSRWRIVDFRPGGTPLRNLAQRLLETEQADDGAPVHVDEISVELLRTRLKREPELILRWCKEGHLPTALSLLLLVDQFEELFRYESYAGREEAEAFVARLLEVKEPRGGGQDQQIPAYVAITMRSEYLGAGALIEGLAEAINEGTFLTPRMTREECRQAIVGPAKVCGIDIEERLVNRLLNDLADFASWEDGAAQSQLNRADEHDQLSRLARRADQLPLMQHALNRMWEEAKNKTSIELTLADYESIGGLQGALGKHADQVLGQLEAKLGKERCQAITETVFRAVTSGTTAADAVRYPRPFGTLVKLCGDEEGVTAVVNAFRAAGCNFLVPGLSVPLLPDTYIDISHESLIRQWSRLSGWLVQESRSSQFWHRLVDAATSYRRGEGGLLEGRSLETLASWRDIAKPSEAWAARYGGDYADAIKFLNESIKARHRRIRSRLSIGAGTTVLALVVAGIVAALWFQRQITETARQTVEANLKKLDDNVRETARFALNRVAADVQDSQTKGDWATAWNLLSHTVGEVEQHIRPNPSVFDESAAQTLYLRELEQHVRASKSTPTTDLGLEGGSLEVLDTGQIIDDAPSANRFTLLGSRSNYEPLYLVDRITGTVLASSGDLRRAPRLEKDSVRHYLSAGGQHAVVVTRDGTVFDWDVQGSKVNEISFDLARIASDSEKADGTNPLAKRDILSIARDPKSQHVALMIATEGHNPRIIVSKADDGAGPQVDVNVLARKIEEHSQVDLSSASLVGYSGGLLITELHLRGQSDGLFLLNAKTGEVETLFSWPVIGRSRLTPDGQTVLIVTGWDPTQGCQSTAGGLADESATGDNSTFSGGGSSCLVLIDLERRKGTILAHLPVDSAVLDIATAATGRGSPTTYEVLLRAAGAYRFLKIVRADDGDYSVEGGANADAAPFIELHPNDLPTQPALPLLFRVGRSFTGVARSGQVVVAADITNDRDLALAITRYEDETPAVDPIAGRVRVHFHSFNLQSPGLSTVIPASPIYHRRGRSRESQSGLQGALDGDGHYLLLVFQSDAAPGQMFGAFIDLQDTNGADRVASWVPIQPNTDVCGDAKNIQFGDIRYWGNQQRDASPSSRTSAFIGVDDNNNLWRATVDYDPTSPKITLDCLNRLFGRAQILDAGGDQGLAVVQSNSTYVYSLFANVNSGATYSQTALDLPRAPQAAALLQSKIALAMDNGDIWTAEPRPEWSVALALRGAVSHVAALASDKQNLLVTADNGFALLLAFDSGRLSPVGTARLPMAGLDDYQLSLDTAHNAVRVIYAGTMDRYDLRSSPAGKDIESLIAARGSVVPKSKRDWADLLMRLSGAANQVELPHSALINVDDSAKCRLTINALLTFEDVEFEGNKPPLRRLSELTGAAKRDCGQAQSNASPAAVPLAIVHVVENLGKEANRWPIEWSLLLQAAERGDRAALRTYLLALNSSKSALIQKVARSVWSQLQRPGIFVARDQIRRCSTGDTLTRLDKDQLEDRFDADDGDKHMLVGCLLDRDAATTSERSKALRHFWLAEELYRISGRADDEATASRRRAALARALPDETIRAVRRDLAAWQIEGKSAAAPPFGAVPESASERFARDADRLQTIDESLSHDHLLVPLRTVLLWQLAQSLRAENESSARQSYRQAVEVLESTSAGPLLDPVSLMEWSSELADFHEHALAARVLIKALGSFKDNNANNIDGMNTYRRVVSALSDEVTTSAEARDVATKYLRFDPFLFGYGSRTVAREAHEDTLKLINSILPVSDVNVNWRIQRGVTQFWLGVIAKDGASRDSTPETQVQRLKEAAAQYFKDAARDFKLAEAQQASNLDLEFMQAELLRYSGNTHVDFREYDQAAREFEQAARKYEDVIAATESKTRSFPLPLADLLSVFASVQDNLSFQAIRFAESVPQFDGRLNNELEAKFRSLVWSSVDSAQRFELARKRADEVSESDTWAARQGIGFGYTIALLNGYIRFLHDPSHSAVPACDLLASAFVDPLRRSPGTIVFGSRDFGDAKSPCEEALSTHPDDPHNMFMVSRVTDDLALAVSAAKANYAAGFNEIAYEIQESKGYKNEDSRNGTLHSYYDRMCQAYTQRVLLVSFPDVYSYLKGDASAERRRGPLQWIAAKAAALGMPEGHFGLAELMEDNVDRWIHLQLAAKFAGGARPGDVQGRVFGKTAAEIENLAAGISLTDEERRKAQETVDAWPQPEALIEVPPELFDEVQKARDLSK